MSSEASGCQRRADLAGRCYRYGVDPPRLEANMAVAVARRAFVSLINSGLGDGPQKVNR